jgi:hypothetical protein
MIAEGSAPVNATQPGRIPNDAFFHAEVTCLTRAARANGGTLSNLTIEVTVDRGMCSSCKILLPHIGLKLGNPRVRFIDDRGRVRIMQNGSWLEE